MLDNRIELSDVQRDIVESIAEAICVQACAGSGKTRVLTERVRHLLNVNRSKVIALTFTNKAALEIKNRLSDISDLSKRSFIGTFHGLCQYILENHGIVLGYSTMPQIFESRPDRHEIIEQAIEMLPSYYLEYDRKDNKEKKLIIEGLESYISQTKRSLSVPLETFDAEENIKQSVYQNYEEILMSQNAIDFDDLILKAYILFSDYPNVAQIYRNQFCAVCVDEAQDLNSSQYEFVKILCGDTIKNIMFVGDPNQSIFHFTGSSPHYITHKFIEDFSPDKYVLSDNYRSSKKVLKAASQIMSSEYIVQSVVKDGIYELTDLNNESEEAEWVTNKVLELIEMKVHSDIEGDITLEKIAILARNIYLFKPIEECLKAKNIAFNYRVSSSTLSFESKLMMIFINALRVRLNPKDILHKKKLLTLLNMKEDKLNYNLLELSDLSSNTKTGILKVVCDLSIDGHNLRSSLNNYRKTVDIDSDEERLMFFNDVDEIINNWHSYSTNTDNKSLLQFMNAMALGRTKSYLSDDGVTLSTVHTMKGQEFDIVFLIGLDDETFPDYRAIRSGGMALKQEKNNLYVAYTRSKRFLYVTYPKLRTMPWGDEWVRKISSFLERKLR